MTGTGPRTDALVFSGDLIRVSPTRNLCELGLTRFVDGVPQPELTVSMSAATEFVRQAHPEWGPGVRMLIAARAAGRAAAHELGHYLLGDPAHRSTV